MSSPSDMDEVSRTALEDAVEIPELDIATTAHQRFDIGEHVVEIRTQLGRQDVWIDGLYQRYTVSRSGYTLRNNPYAPPQKSLLDAVRLFLETSEPRRVIGFRLFPDRQIATQGEVIEPRPRPQSGCGRKNFRDLTTQERNRLACALNELYERGLIEEFAEEHNDNWNNIHWGPAFLPWHRHFLLRLERALHTIDRSVFLPYWDWTREDSRDIFNSPTWVSFFGDRNNNGGRFDHWAYHRGATAGGASLPTLQSIVNVLRGDTFQEYRTIECNLHHTGPHVWVGGDMAQGRSPRDPLFYLHHCNIDRYWATWQRNNAGAQQYNIVRTGCDQGQNAIVERDEPMAGGSTPADVLDHTRLGYFYGPDSRLEAAWAGEGLPPLATGDRTHRAAVTRQIFFGLVVVGDVRLDQLNVSNVGSLPLDIVVPRLEDGVFFCGGLQTRMRPCDRHSLSVTFYATATGTATRTIEVITSPPDNPADQTIHTVKISGRGIEGQVP